MISPPDGPTRRNIVQGTMALAASSLLTPFTGAVTAAPKLSANPFEMLGVASGDAWQAANEGA